LDIFEGARKPAQPFQTIPCDDRHRSLAGGDALKIVIGGLIALAVIGYVASQWKKFD
jgi:hypothetical protein